MRPSFPRFTTLLALLGFGCAATASAAVVIDGSFADWERIAPIYVNPNFSTPSAAQSGVSFIKTYQDDTCVYFSFASANPTGNNGAISFDLDRNSSLADTFISMHGEAAWVLGNDGVFGSAVLSFAPQAARGMPDPARPGYYFYEWCFQRDQLLADGTPLFPDSGDDVWFAVAQSGETVAGSQLTTFTIDLVPVPEPSTVGLALLGLGMMTRRRRKRAV